MENEKELENYRFEFTGEEKFRIKVFRAYSTEEAYKLADEYLSRNNLYDDWEYIPYSVDYPKY